MIKFNPNLFVLGFAKCGTTTIHNLLSQHKDVCMSKRKEPKYFSTDEYSRGASFYRNEYFKHYAEEPIVGEACPNNVWIPYVGDRIAESSDNPKFIIMLRNPVDRFYSDWSHFKNMRPGREPRSFEKVVSDNVVSLDLDAFEFEGDYVSQMDVRGGCYTLKYLEQSHYYHHSNRYVEKFGLENIHFVIFEDFIKNQQAEASKIFDFIGVEDFNIVETMLNENVKDANKKNWASKYPRQYASIFNAIYYDINSMSKLLNVNLFKKWGLE